jgi:hypothetical protein
VGFSKVIENCIIWKDILAAAITVGLNLERERERERSGRVVKDTTFRVRKKESIYPV